MEKPGSGLWLSAGGPAPVNGSDSLDSNVPEVGPEVAGSGVPSTAFFIFYFLHLQSLELRWGQGGKEGEGGRKSAWSAAALWMAE